MFSREYPLDISVRTVRVLCATIVVVLAIVWIVVVFTCMDIELTSFNSDEKNEEQRKDLLDYYNTLSGGIANAISKIVELILQGLVAVGMLSFATTFTFYDYKYWYSRYSTALATVALGYLISSGLSALNVQVVPGEVTIQMNSSDLALPVLTNATVAVDGVLDSAWDKSFSETTKGNSVLNTVFRSFILPFDASSDGICTSTDYRYPEASVSFGYPSRSWHAKATLKISDTEKAVQFNLNTDLDNLDNEELPMDENIAIDLLVDMLELGWSWVRDPIEMDNYFFDKLKYGEALDRKFREDTSATSFSIAEVANLTKETRGEDNFLQASTRLLRSALYFNKEETSSLTIDNSTVKYSQTPISDVVVFDSLTLELSFPVNLSFSSIYQCSRNGCWNKIPLEGEGFNQHVRAYGQCLNKDGTEETRIYRENDDYSIDNTSCVGMSNSSIRVFSGGRRLAGDTLIFDAPESLDFGGVKATQARQIYSVTMGRLSWRLQDLSTRYDAQCSAGSCQGVWAMVDSSEAGTSHLLLGESGIPLQQLQYGPISAAGYGNFWTYLVQVVDPRDWMVDAVLPRMFDHLDKKTDSLKRLEGQQCSKENELAIDRALKDHIYIEDSHQAACIGAFHFLFQSAVEHQPLDFSELVVQQGSSSSTPRLQFSGNIYQMTVRASIPFISMLLSVLGCAILLVVGVTSVYYRIRSTDRIRDLTDARTVAEAMINSIKFPPWLLQFTIEHQQESIPLEHVQIKSVELMQDNKLIREGINSEIGTSFQAYQSRSGEGGGDWCDREQCSTVSKVI
ncbi:hypothetical protein P3T76_015378 [Phytophthora citrophthora]|uniref:Uncharacterized protein n=1 Tax=Phytophthora citrophthora TaxID=4793 RepID=A0AAD9FZH9_9STRA|nr:hypothetical protein P3T76_015378 [Phytophthora citrophthora]